MRVTRQMQAAQTMRRHALQLKACAERLAEAAGVLGGTIARGDSTNGRQLRRENVLAELTTAGTLYAELRQDWLEVQPVPKAKAARPLLAQVAEETDENPGVHREPGEDDLP